MNQLQLFLPCAAGVEDMLAHEAAFITGGTLDGVRRQRGGVLIEGAWRDALLLNLHSRLAQRVLVQLAEPPAPPPTSEAERIAGDSITTPPSPNSYPRR